MVTVESGGGAERPIWMFDGASGSAELTSPSPLWGRRKPGHRISRRPGGSYLAGAFAAARSLIWDA